MAVARIKAHAEYQRSENYKSKTLQPQVKKFCTFLQDAGHEAFQSPNWTADKTVARLAHKEVHREAFLRRFTCNDDCESFPILPKDCVVAAL